MRELAPLFELLEQNGVFCPSSVRVGPRGDGGKFVCEQHVRERLTNEKPCTLLAAGLFYDTRFESAVNRRYGCETHGFDLSLIHI